MIVHVIGGSGFLGSHLCGAIEADGHAIRIIDDQRAADPLGLRPYGLGHPVVIPASIETMCRAAPNRLLECDAIFYLAADPLRSTLYEYRAALDSNVGGLATFLDLLASRLWPGRFIYVSSSEVHGNAPGPHGADGPFDPQTPYAIAKYAAERLVHHASRWCGLDAIIVRPFNLYGPHAHWEGMRGEAIPRFMVLARAGCRLPVYGTTRRDYVFVDDCAHGLIRAWLFGFKGETVVLGTGISTPMSWIAEEILRLSHGNGAIEYHPPRPCDTQGLMAECGAVAARIGWRPTVKLGEGLTRTWDWFSSITEEDFRRMLAGIADVPYAERKV